MESIQPRIYKNTKTVPQAVRAWFKKIENLFKKLNFFWVRGREMRFDAGLRPCSGWQKLCFKSAGGITMKKPIIVLFALFLQVACRSGGTIPAPPVNPGLYFIHLGRGIAALQEKDFPAALHFLKLAVAERPDSPRALNLRGIALLMRGRAGEAKVDFERVIALDPGYESAYQNLGCCLVRKKEPAEAEIVLRRALERFPRSASLHFTLGSVLVLREKAEEALEVMRRGMDLDPAYFSREKRFETESDLQGGGPALFFSYARLFAARGDVGKTVEYLRQARKAGFSDWQRILELADFDPVRDDPALKEFLD